MTNRISPGMLAFGAAAILLGACNTGPQTSSANQSVLFVPARTTDSSSDIYECQGDDFGIVIEQADRLGYPEGWVGFYSSIRPTPDVPGALGMKFYLTPGARTELVHRLGFSGNCEVLKSPGIDKPYIKPNTPCAEAIDEVIALTDHDGNYCVSGSDALSYFETRK